MKNYIGLALSPHDTSIAIVDKNGELRFAEAAERPLQSKRSWGIVPDHINYIEELVDGYCDRSVDTVVGSTWSKETVDGLDMFTRVSNFRIRTAAIHKRKWLTTYKYMALAHKSVLNWAGTGVELAFAGTASRIERRYFNHHITHAAAASYASGLEDGLCVVLDGYGEMSSIAAFEYRNGALRHLEGVSAFSASLGVFYALLTEICGFNSLKGEEWKLMGLASYGKVNDKLYELVRPLIRVNGLTLQRGKRTGRNNEILHSMRRMPTVPAMEYADFAATIQRVYTETVHELLRNLHDLGISDNLIMTGGCALNSSANGTLLEYTPFKRLYVGSAPADDGNAVGAAYLAYYQDNPFPGLRDAVLTPYLGSAVKERSLANLKRFGGIRYEEVNEEVLYRATARALAEGKIVGWVQGRAEFGPRSLGNRSILADPRGMGVKERINAEVKFREEFRPFAPSILHDHGDEYFEHYQFSPYMERTLRFKDSVKSKVPGVVHVDGTGRLQSVTVDLNARYYRLIHAFKELTGVPVLLNTSFNVMGKPIIHSVEDAVAVFQTSGLDLLVVENTVFLKDSTYRFAA